VNNEEKSNTSKDGGKQILGESNDKRVHDPYNSKVNNSFKSGNLKKQSTKNSLTVNFEVPEGSGSKKERISDTDERDKDSPQLRACIN